MTSAARPSRQHRAGITTVQPGLDDATSDSYNSTAISNSHMYTGGDPAESDHVIAGSALSLHASGAHSEKTGKAPSMAGSPPQKKEKKSLFSRVAGTSKNKDKEKEKEKEKEKHSESFYQPSSNSDKVRSASPPLRVPPLQRAGSATMYPHSMNSSTDEYDSHGSSTGTARGQGSPTAPVNGKHVPNLHEFYAASPPKPLPVVKKKRDKKTNTEATLLRNQMLATEYELQRLGKTIKKKTVVAAPAVSSPGGKEAAVKVDKHHISQAEYASLQAQQNEQQLKLQQLRNKYTELTGEQYVAQKSTLSRILGRSSAQPAAPTSTNTGTGSGIAYTSNPMANEGAGATGKGEHNINFTFE